MLKKFIWFFGVLGLFGVVFLLYLTTIAKSDAPDFANSLPSSFFATEYNNFSKSFHSSTLHSITTLDKKTLIAVGKYGVILKSSDGGESFKKINSPTESWLHSITTLDNKTLIAVGKYGVILKSSDGGESFKKINSPTKSWLRSITTLDNKTLIAVGSGVILKSSDGGDNFIEINSLTTSYLTSIIALDSKTLIMVGKYGIILKSSDSGESFREINSPTTSTLYSITALDKKTLIAVGSSGVILKSSDGGESFREINSPTKSWLTSIIALDKKTLIAVGDDGVILKSSDGGDNFIEINSLTKYYLTSIIALDNKTLITVGGGGVILKSSDGGDNFIEINSLTTSYLTSIIALDSKTLIMVGKYGIILKSSDSGESFREINSSTKSRLTSITALDKKTLIAVGSGGVILKSSDGGESFREINSPTTSTLYSITALDKKTLIAVGSSGVILKSSDSGESFREINSPTTSYLISITALDSKTLIAVGGANLLENGIILKSSDGGESFREINSPTTSTLYSITALDKKTLIAVGRHSVILKSSDGGESFKKINSPTKSWLTSITTLDKKTLIAVGRYSVILKSSDRGESFERIKSGINNILHDAYYFNNRVYIAGDKLGIAYLDTKEWKLHFLEYATQKSSWFYPMFGVFLLYLVLWLFLLYHFTKESDDSSANLSNDKALDAISQDRYGTVVLAESLVTLVSSPYTKAPLSIAIDAPWGSGKSSLVQMSQVMLKELGVKSLLFNAWYHQEEKHLLASLMEQMQKHFTPEPVSFENLIFRANLFIKRVLCKPVGWLKLLLVLGFVYVAFRVDFAVGFDIEGYLKPLSIVLLLAFVLRELKAYSSTTQWFIKQYRTLFSFKKFSEHLGLRDEFRDEIDALLSPSGKSVVFIDDIDRCQDEEIFKIMQTVNYLASIDNLFIVMAVDKSRVEDALYRHYKHYTEDGVEAKKLAKDYLQKIFNITLKIPPVDSKFYKDKRFKVKSTEKEAFVSAWSLKESRFFRVLKSLWIEWLGMVLLFGGLWYYSTTVESVLGSGATYISELVHKSDKKKEIKVEDGNYSKPVIDVNKTKRYPQEQIDKEKKGGAVFIPPHIKQVSWYERVVVWIGVLLLVAFGVLGVFLMFKLRKERFKKAQSIYKIVDEFPSLSPRERNILFNKINLFISIGSKEYWQNMTFANGLKSVRVFFFNGFLFLLYLIVLPWDGRRTLKTRFQLAFRYAFEIFGGIKSSDAIQEDIESVEKVLKGKKVSDSRFEVVGFEEIVGRKKPGRYY